MTYSIDFITLASVADFTENMTQQLTRSDRLIRKVYVLDPNPQPESAFAIEHLPTTTPFAADTLQKIFASSTAEALLFALKPTPVSFCYRAIERMLAVLCDTGAGLVYGDYLEQKGADLQLHPTIDMTLGSGRDSFEFGPLVLVSRDAINRAIDQCGALLDSRYAGFYDLWLKVVETSAAFRIPEVLTQLVERDLRATGAKQHDYLNPAIRDAQLEYERAHTSHLQRVKAFLPPCEKMVNLTADKEFPVCASVIIPVRNREKTIRDAVQSALSQQCAFEHNVIVVDNHSTDTTTRILSDIQSEDSRLVHVVPDMQGLGIGGCWDFGMRHPACGQWAVQLDSDDLYTDDQVLARIVNELQSGPYAMVVASYQMVDFNLNELPPGVIDHREWTPDNGHNNLLRVNGVGAPRAFHTRTLRQLGFPNITYGEDYAVALRFTREYALGRIYDPVYLCRRWEDNSDAALPIEIANRYTCYKDRIRTLEMLARQQRTPTHSL